MTGGGDETKTRHALEIVDYSIGHMKHTKEQKQNQKLMISYFDKSTQLLGLLCLWQCLNPAQAKRSGGGMGGVDQAQVILSQLNATNKVNSKLSLSVLCSVSFCLLWTQIRQPDEMTKNVRRKTWVSQITNSSSKVLSTSVSRTEFQLNNIYIDSWNFQENLAWSRK